jgi:hypothetical protein
MENKLIKAGVLLFLLGLITGFGIPAMKRERLFRKESLALVLLHFLSPWLSHLASSFGDCDVVNKLKQRQNYKP